MLTKKEQQVLDMFIELGDKQAVANKLGISRSTVRQTIKRMEAKGAAPWLTPAFQPDHLSMSKTTVQYGADGTPVQEWRRLNPTAEMMQDVIDGLRDQVMGIGKAPKRKERKTDTQDILAEFAVYDPHIGMYADERETLDKNYDTAIAAKCMVDTVDRLATRFNRPHKAVVVFGGDIMHSDNRNNQTEKSHNVLDVDTRYNRVVKYVRSACTDVIRIAASVAAEVEVVVVRGNHDWHSCVWLAEVLDAMYFHCPNVTVQRTDAEIKKLVFGDNFLLWAHGDSIPMNKWGQIIPAAFPKEWGATTHRHLQMGHVHHKKAIAPVVYDEQSGILVEYLEALCPNDAYHTGKGYIGSQRGCSGFEYHRNHGLITRYLQPAVM